MSAYNSGKDDAPLPDSFKKLIQSVLDHLSKEATRLRDPSVLLLPACMRLISFAT